MNYRRGAICLCAALALVPGVESRGQERYGAPSADEVMSTARGERAPSWRYMFDTPPDRWAEVGFDDSKWAEGRAGFGSAGTPTIRVGTPWTTRDVWMRRTFVVPAGGASPATYELAVFHDEDAEVYFNGVPAARFHGYTRDYEFAEIAPEARALLTPGASVVVGVHCRQTGGGQGIDAGIVSVSGEMIARHRRDRARSYAMSNPGNPEAGRRLFADTGRLACAKCHTVDGSAGLAGPDLYAAGDKFTRPELVDAILDPARSVAVGYATTVVTTKGGDAYVGVVKEADDAHVGIMGADGKLVRVPAGEIKSRKTTNDSLMPAGQEGALSPGEFADLVAYLAGLRLPAVAGAARAGMPAEIEELRPSVGLVPIHRPEDRFNHPAWVGQVPGEAGIFLVCEHETGKIWRLATGSGGGSKTLWGDFRSEVRPGGATGLLGLAFHPRFRENRRYFVQHQVVVNGRIHSRVSEKIAAADFSKDSGEASRVVLDVTCSTDVHSGGGIEFGPDGYLYLGMGDTGPQGDPEGHGQDMGTMLGKMLRIDVDRHEEGKGYGVPADNPFVGKAGVRPEIWAYGFREPWRFSFDPANGDLWVGDVGQDRIEEVDLVRRGENFGWNVYEGFDLFSTRRRTEGAAYVPPVFAYTRRLGASVTGGYVVRGGNFDGVYVCADFVSRRVWGIRQKDRKLDAIWQLCQSPEQVSSFGRDAAGSVYLVGYEGTIFRMDFAAAGTPGK